MMIFVTIDGPNLIFGEVLWPWFGESIFTKCFMLLSFLG